MEPSVWVFDHTRHHLQAVLVEQGVVLRAVYARMVQAFPRKGPDCLAMRWTAREHQRSARSGVLAENRKHPALMFVTQMEEAVPGENTVEGMVQSQFPHVCDLPAPMREMTLAHSDHLR